MTSSRGKDLVVLAADKDIEFTIRGLLVNRVAALGIRPVSFDIYTHPEHDPACLQKAHEFLRVFLGSHGRALVVFDRIGCGRESSARTTIESEVERRLDACGWSGRSAAIAIDPELEAWVWSDSPHVEGLLGWTGAPHGLRAWLGDEGVWAEGSLKPHDPKRAVDRARFRAKKPRSSALYRSLAEQVSLSRCTDQAFTKLRETLRGWFGS